MKYKQANDYTIPTLQTQVVFGPGNDKSNKLFGVYLENKGPNAVTVYLVDLNNDLTRWVIPLAVNEPGITIDNIPWETIANGIQAIATGASTVLKAAMWEAQLDESSNAGPAYYYQGEQKRTITTTVVRTA